jgi:hypothetical protein
MFKVLTNSLDFKLELKDVFFSNCMSVVLVRSNSVSASNLRYPKLRILRNNYLRSYEDTKFNFSNISMGLYIIGTLNQMFSYFPRQETITF